MLYLLSPSSSPRKSEATSLANVAVLKPPPLDSDLRYFSCSLQVWKQPVTVTEFLLTLLFMNVFRWSLPDGTGWLEAPENASYNPSPTFLTLC